MVLRNFHIALTFSQEHHGALVSMFDPTSGEELLRDREAPRLLWRLGLRRHGEPEIEWLTSDQAASLDLKETRASGSNALTLTSGGLPGLVSQVVVRVSLADDSALSAWQVQVRGVEADVAICEVTCPVICGLVKLGDPAPGETLIFPVQDEAYLFRNPFPVRDRLPLCAGAGPEEADVGVGQVGGRYPGQIALQMAAFYHDDLGLYLATHDAGQHPKTFHMGPRPDLGEGPVLSVSHHVSEIPGADLAIPYETILGLFHGDWYDVADLYREWATRQWWCEKTLWERDLADWLRRGVGGVWQMSNYHIPRLDLNHSLDQIAETVNAVSARAGVPLLGLVFNWEQGGAWTGPRGFFPPREGEAQFRAAMQKLCDAGNFGFVYITGNNWYVKIGYDPPWDSWPQFLVEGEQLALRRPDGEYTVMSWYGNWEIVRLCPEPEAALELHADIFLGCLDLGCTVVQIDNFPCGGSEACYDSAHGHPLGHGPWWSEACARMLEEIRRRAKAKNPQCAISTEGVAENFIPWLDLCDQRAGNMEYFGHYGRGLPMGGETIPLFNTVYNEYIGSYYAAYPECNRPEVLYWTRGIGKAICQGVLPAAGRYFPDPPDSNPITLAFFTRIARATGTDLYPYLMFGRMLRPPDIESPTFTAQYCKFLYDAENFRHHLDPMQRHEVTDRAIQHAAYRGRDGSVCVLFVNVSEEPVELSFELPAYDLSGRVNVQRITNSEPEEWLADVALPQPVELAMAPLCITLLIMREAKA
jgi:hypothetical protein